MDAKFHAALQRFALKVLTEIQDRFVNGRVGPVIPEIIQVVVKVNQALIGPAHQQGGRDLLCFAPILKSIP